MITTGGVEADVGIQYLLTGQLALRLQLPRQKSC